MNNRAQKYLSKQRDTSTMVRAMAFIIDRCIIALVTSLLLVLIYYCIFGHMGNQTNPVILSALPINIRMFTDAAFILIILIYKIFIPLKSVGSKKVGQTIGKYIMRIQIVTNRNEQINWKHLIVRDALVILFIEFSARFFDIHVFIRDFMFAGFSINPPILIEYIGTIIVLISIINCVFIDKKHRMFHDLIARTKVITLDD